jgi:predicted GNAT family acetyltransferase
MIIFSFAGSNTKEKKMVYKVKHDAKEHRFYIDMEHQVSELKYKKVDDKTLDFYSTYVPESLRNKGLAGHLVEYALEYVKEHNHLIIPSCPFVKKYIDEHDEYASLVKNKHNRVLL